jgi:outer membrane lipoprotein SlyB
VPHPRIRLALAVLACTACAAKRPVLYPNQHYRDTGSEVSQADIDTCMQLAEAGVGDKNVAANTAGRTAVGAGGGGAVGAVGGAITGNAGTGAAVGAATGATAGLLSGLWRTRDHDPTYMAWVETCLREKGYQPIGWK